MRVLFIGGTGRLSNDVAKLACEKGNEVFILTRGSNSRKEFVDSKFKMIYSNIRDVERTKEVLYDIQFDVVIDFLTFNVNQLKDTLKILENKYKQYIFISTATVYDKKDEHEIISEDETKIGNTKWSYAYNKYLCEVFIKKYFMGKNCYYTIVRPYVTYNKTRIPYPIIPQINKYEYSIIERIKNGKSVPIIDGGAVKTTITNSKDFAKGTVGLFNNPYAYNDAFHITSDEKVCWGDVLNVISKKYNVQLKTVNFTIEEFSKKYPEFKEILCGDKGHEMTFDNSKIKNAVSEFKCTVSLVEGLQETIEYYENNPNSKIIDYYWYGRIDAICKDKKEKKFKTKMDKAKYLLGYFNCPKLILKFFKKVGLINDN